MAFNFPQDAAGFTGAVRETPDGSNFTVPVIIYGADGVTPIFESDVNVHITNTDLPVRLKGSSLFEHDRVTITTPLEATQLPSLSCREVTIHAHEGNFGAIYIGKDNTVSPTNYAYKLYAEDDVTLPLGNLDMIFVTGDTTGEGLTYVAH